MTESELLELAAKAAGELHLVPYKEEWFESEEVWNPLIHDGDALRLAVNIGMWISIDRRVLVCGGPGPDVIENFNDDPYAATRRAIVRAAAEIGKEMP